MEELYLFCEFLVRGRQELWPPGHVAGHWATSSSMPDQEQYSLLNKFWRISLYCTVYNEHIHYTYVTDDAIYFKALCDEKFSQMEWYGPKFSITPEHVRTMWNTVSNCEDFNWSKIAKPSVLYLPLGGFRCMWPMTLLQSSMWRKM